MNAAARTILATVLMTAPLSGQVQAREAPQGWSLTAGAGMIYVPAYLGADNYELLALPDIRIAYADKFFFSVREGAGYNIINRNGWRIGPVVRYEFGREEDGKNPFRVAGEKTNDLLGLGDVDGTAEVGGFVEYRYADVSAKVAVRQAVGGHGSAVGEAEVRYSRAFGGSGPPIIFSIGPNLKIAGSGYNDAYFGISAGQAVRSGLAPYDAGSGLVSFGIGGALIVPVAERISMAVFAAYDRLGKEAADSPLVKMRGSRTQAAIGVSFGYEF